MTMIAGSGKEEITAFSSAARSASFFISGKQKGDEIKEKLLLSILSHTNYIHRCTRTLTGMLQEQIGAVKGEEWII